MSIRMVYLLRGETVMDMQKHTVYVRAYKRTTIEAKKQVKIGDIADIAAPPTVKGVVDNMQIYAIPETHKKGKFVITIIDIVNKIWSQYPNADVQSVGDPDVVIEYHPKISKQNSILEWIKAIAVAIIIFAGATVAIMTYNTDTSLGKTFIIINRIFTGREVDTPNLITIPYAIGLATGVLFFFNHFGKRKITEDPTPMQVEIAMYEKDAEDSEIDSLTDTRRGEP